MNKDYHISALLCFAHLNTIGRPITHGFFWLYPRTAGLTPSRTVEDTHLDAQFASCLQGCAQILPPKLTLELVLTVYLYLCITIQTVADIGSQECQRDAVVLHPFQVGYYTFGIDALVNPIVVTPHTDAVGRCEERLEELVTLCVDRGCSY